MDLEETTEKTSLMNKKPGDLTVNESLKLQAGIIAVLVAIPVAVGGAVVAVETVKTRVRAWKINRQAKKAVVDPDEK